MEAIIGISMHLSIILTLSFSLRSLSEAMSIERIAAIKAKRLAIKRTMIKEDVDDLGLGNDLRCMLEFDIDVTKDITTKERQWRTRTTILQSSGKVIVILSHRDSVFIFIYLFLFFLVFGYLFISMFVCIFLYMLFVRIQE